MDDKAILDAAKDSIILTGDKKSIKCQDALKLAEKLDIPAVQIGATLNRNEIKIVSCQLGCFK